MSIELAKAALEGFNITYKSLNEQQQEEIDKRFALEATIATEEAALEQEKAAFIEKEKELQHMQHAFNDLLSVVRDKESEKSLATQRLEYLNERKGSLGDFLQKAEGQLSGIEESLQFTQEQIGEEEQKLGASQMELDTLKGAVEEKRRIFDEQRASVDELRRENQSLQRNQFDAEKKVAVADTSILNLQRAIFQGKEESSQRQYQLKQLDQDKKEKETEWEQRKTDLQQLQEKHELTREQILQTQGQLEILRNELADENRKLDARRNEHDLLKSLIDSMEGYPESVKFLHKNKQWNHEAPILSDIIYVKEEFRAAVENVLEPYLNYYVVNDLEEGLQSRLPVGFQPKRESQFLFARQGESFRAEATITSHREVFLLCRSLK